jgi:hypothetical protein
MQSTANTMTMPPGEYKASHISQWSVLIASSEAPKCHKRASARTISPRRPQWSSMAATQQTQQKTQLLASNYDTFYLARIVIFVTQKTPYSGHQCNKRCANVRCHACS